MNKELNIGDYVRTKNKTFQPSQIAKIKNIEKDMVYKGQKCLNLDHNLLTNYEFLIYKEDILKSSPNIIDLIEVGDYVNGSKVINVVKDKHYGNYVSVEYSIIKNFEVQIAEIYDEEDIKSIVTKEQFESMEYKIGE